MFLVGPWLAVVVSSLAVQHRAVFDYHKSGSGPSSGSLASVSNKPFPGKNPESSPRNCGLVSELAVHDLSEWTPSVGRMQQLHQLSRLISTVAYAILKDVGVRRKIPASSALPSATEKPHGVKEETDAIQATARRGPCL